MTSTRTHHRTTSPGTATRELEQLHGTAIRRRAALVLVAVLTTWASALTPWAPQPARAAPGDVVVVNGQAHPVAGIDTYRYADQLIIYTRANGQTISPANQWGFEAAVVGGRVTAARDRVSGAAAMAIPVDGVVLSGHGTAASFLQTRASVGAPVTLPASVAAPTPTSTPTPSPSPTATPTPTPSPTGTTVPNAPAGSVARIGTAQYPIAGTNIARAADALVLYTRAGGQTVSPANMWGEEIAVLNGTITAIRDRQSTGAAGMPIPDGGYVLSGHGAARTWLVTHARVGGTVTITTATPSPTPTPSATPTASGSCPAGYVRLTFDDGPVATGSTASVLDTLRRYGRTATFFMVGSQAQGNPDLVRRVAAEGHRIGNHTWDHPSLPGLSDAEIRSQLTRTSDAVEQLTGRRPSEWRPPYGEWDERVRWNATAVGLGTMTLWDVDTLDWQGPSPEVIRDRVVAGAYDGATVLMHDRIANTATALPMILDGLAARGFCTR